MRCLNAAAQLTRSQLILHFPTRAQKQQQQPNGRTFALTSSQLVLSFTSFTSLIHSLFAPTRATPLHSLLHSFLGCVTRSSFVSLFVRFVNRLSLLIVQSSSLPSTIGFPRVMQKNPTANEQYSSTLACNNQQPAAANEQSTRITTSNAVLNSNSNSTATSTNHSTSVTSFPAVSPALASLSVTDSPYSPSSQLSLAASSASRSQPSSPSSPSVSRHDSLVRSVSSSDSAAVVGALPVTPAGCASAVGRVRVPLSAVVTSLTQRWSMDYLAEAEAGDVDAQCLVAQMYLTGWGALKEDQAEGKRWLQRAKDGGIAGTVNKLELLYLGDHDSSGGDCSAAAAGTAQTCGYYSGYANTPQPSPSAALLSSLIPTPTSSFFASVAATISPKPAVAPPALSRSKSLFTVGAGTGVSGSGRLSVPSVERTVGVPSGSGSGSSSSGDEQQHHHHHAHHWRADRHMHHGRELSGELGVSAS